MQVTRIDLAGEPGRYATLKRRPGGEYLEVTILTPRTPRGRVHNVQVDSNEDLWSMAECLKDHLARRGAGEHETEAYYRQLAVLVDQ